MGGGIFNWNSTLFIKEDVSFNNNQAEYGAGGDAQNTYGETVMGTVCINGNFTGCPTSPMTAQSITPDYLMGMLLAGAGAGSELGPAALNGNDGWNFGVGGGGAGNSFDGVLHSGGEGSIRASSGEGTSSSNVTTATYLNGDGGNGGAFGAAIFNYEGGTFFSKMQCHIFK